MGGREAYSFSKDIESLRRNVDLLTKDPTPLATERCCNRIKGILDRILDNRQQSHVPYEVKEYFKEEE